jgi:hypothetical protein
MEKLAIFLLISGSVAVIYISFFDTAKIFVG